jgi:hypothetical protein
MAYIGIADIAELRMVSLPVYDIGYDIPRQSSVKPGHHGHKVNNRRPGGTKRESKISKRTIFNFATKEISKDFGIFILHINWDNPCFAVTDMESSRRTKRNKNILS